MASSTSMASPNSWSPYNNYRDCSTGICSLYCPQWCYIVFPPPPPFPAGEDSSVTTNLSPLIISVIGILASAFLLIAYYTLITKYCKRRRAHEVHHEPAEPSMDLSHIQHHHQADQWQGPTAASAGLDQSLIESIAVCSYRKGDGLVEEGSTECAVCLSEFQENEKLRLLPKCNHAFHLPCIDTWLKSHSNCPLCRANVAPPQTDISSSFNVSSLRVEPRRDLVVVVEDPERGYRTEAVVEFTENVEEDSDEKLSSPVRLQIFQHRQNLLVSDVLRISEEEEEEIYRETHRLPVEIGSSRGTCEDNGIELGRFSSSSSRHDDKGKDSVIPAD